MLIEIRYKGRVFHKEFQGPPKKVLEILRKHLMRNKTIHNISEVKMEIVK